MTPGPFGRARAERFAQLLDETQGAPRKHIKSTHDHDLAPLVEVATTITGLAEETARVRTDDAFRAKLRGRLMAVASVQGIGDTATGPDAIPRAKPEAPAPARGGRRLAVGVTVVFGILALSGMSAASGQAMPGDALYDVKRSTERAQLALAGSDVNRGQLYLEFARNRLDEAASVATDPASVDRTLDDMDDETRQGVSLLTGASVERTDEGVLDAIDTFVETHRVELVDFVASTEAETRSRALDSLGLLDEVEQRSEKLRFSLLCTASGDAEVDTLGPVPLSCSALPDPSHTPAPVDESELQASRDSRPDDPADDADPADKPKDEDDETKDPAAEPTKSPTAGPTGTPGTDDTSDQDDGGGGLLGQLGGILSGLLGG
ncbi:DUF5667 domain-containing protein [Phytomonospora sp. NPDC050363]|uniref:DUF5667 domain-containing protein n=1 Tax=Phytomonospora sp. NPDC050363 TaxID=3155642 RepID=UPI0033CDFF86